MSLTESQAGNGRHAAEEFSFEFACRVKGEIKNPRHARTTCKRDVKNEKKMSMSLTVSGLDSRYSREVGGGGRLYVCQIFVK